MRLVRSPGVDHAAVATSGAGSHSESEPATTTDARLEELLREGQAALTTRKRAMQTKDTVSRKIAELQTYMIQLEMDLLRRRGAK